MKRTVPTCVLVLACLLTGSGAARADVKTDEKTAMKLEGMLGTVAGMFGGKAMKDGLVSTVAVKGDRRFRGDENDAEIVDLNEEKVYQLDMKKRTYTVATFAEIRQKMEEARRKAEEQAAKAQAREKQQDGKRPEMEIDFDVKETGQNRAVNGFDCREVVMTVVVREKGKTLEQAGGMVLTSNQWITAKVPALAEVVDFEMRYMKKLAGPDMIEQAQQLASALAMYPGIGTAMGKMRAEGVKLQGTPIQTISTFEMVASAEQQKEQGQAKSDEGDSPKGMGGLLGGFGRKMMKKKDSDAPAQASAPGRTRVLTMTSETLKVSPSATAEDVAVPAGFKLKN